MIGFERIMAEEYLRRFGWCDPVPWDFQGYGNISAPQEEDQEPSDLSQTLMEGISSGTVEEMRPNNLTEDPLYVEALSKFQSANNLTVTGVLDEATREIMNKPRCGFPDKTSLLNDSLANAPSWNGSSNSSTNHTEAMNSTGPSSSTEPESVRRKRFLDRLMWNARSKRELLGEDRAAAIALGFAKRSLKWRLVGEAYSVQMSISQQRTLLRLAFRMWSEVIPLEFEEDLFSPSSDIDIKLGFGRGKHMGCSQSFDGIGQVFAHAWRLGDIHFDDDEHFVAPSSDQGINLLKVAVHEIGHALGLPHIYRSASVMQPNYIPHDRYFELDWFDRKSMQEIYGICEGGFSTVFDWVHKRLIAGVVRYQFNTYFFRSSWYWMYENKSKRTRYGDPLPISSGWHNLPTTDIEAFVHIWTWNRNVQYFFKGTQYWRYDSNRDMGFTEDVQGSRYPKLIRDGFPGAPSPMDTAYFDRRDNNIYFFRGDQVTAFSVELNRKISGYPKKIIEVFPPVDANDHPIGNINAVYYSYTHRAIFFIKDKYFWKVADKTDRHLKPELPQNGLHPRRRVAEQWVDICDVHPSMLTLSNS
uniref:Matrix metalloproteinase-21-like n=1 Tax=Callorhinchus milii TaxID=7868 RepID=A0A4W3K862_CALMI